MNEHYTLTSNTDLVLLLEFRDAEIAELRLILANLGEQDRLGGVLYRDARVADARAELIAYVKKEFALLAEYEAEGRAVGVQVSLNFLPWKRGVRDVLARFLVAIGETTEADAHAYVDRLINDEEKED